MIYRRIIRPLLFARDAEAIHHQVTSGLKKMMAFPGAYALARKMYAVENKVLEREVFGIRFPNPVGMAAGFDKDAHFFEELGAFGFGFVEIGTLTPRPQPGNDQPRLFRLPKDQALINRMGFNNQGVEVAAARLKERSKGLIIGGNIGKNKTTPNQDALQDYVYCLGHLAPVVDYFVVNVSSPNTPGLRELQEKEPLMNLMHGLRSHMKLRGISKPLLLKIAPDLSEGQIDDIIDIVTSTSTDGVIATNTTISRAGLKTDKTVLESIGSGGLSGRPLRAASTEVIRKLKIRSQNAFPVIGCGGIFTADDAMEKLDAGADLLQVYTGFIYEGPVIVKNILNRLIKEEGNAV